MLALPLLGAAAAQGSEDAGAGGGSGYPSGLPDLTVGLRGIERDWNGHQIVVEIRNVGDAYADESRLLVTLDDAPVHDGRIGPIFPDSGFTYHLFVPDQGYGEVTLRAQVDVDGVIVEANETNNLDEGTFSLGHPDLLVTFNSASPERPEAGDEVWVTATVSNIGDAAARDVDVVMLVDGVQTQPGQAPFRLLHPGESFHQMFRWTALAGIHTLSFVVDSGDTVPETNETNNRADVTFDVGGSTATVDLLVSALWTEPETPRLGETVRVRYQVMNAGETEAPPSRVLVVMDGMVIADTGTAALAPDMSLTFTAYWTATPGSHVLEAHVDADHVVAERDERNNRAARTVYVPAPDLMVEHVAFTGTSQGETFTATISVRNSGGAEAPASMAHVILDDRPPQRLPVPPLGPGQATGLQVELPRAPGIHVVHILLDVEHQVAETDENNGSFHGIDLGQPELSIVARVPDLHGASYGDLMPIQITIDNAGTFPAERFVVAAAADDQPFHRETIRTLQAGHRVDTTLWWKVSPETAVLRFIVDATGTVPEQDEGDNVHDVKVHTGAPELVASGLRYEGTAEVGMPLALKGRIENVGTMGTRAVGVTLAVDGAVVDSWVVDLAPGAVLDLRSDWTPEHDGAHEVTLHVDAYGAVPEQNETDNVDRLKVDVRKATPFACTAGEPATDGLKETCRDLLLGPL